MTNEAGTHRPVGIDALLDRAAIEHHLSRYPFLVDRQRFHDLGLLFAVDGVMDGPVGGPAVGRGAIEEFFRSRQRPDATCIHFRSVGPFELQRWQTREGKMIHV